MTEESPKKKRKGLRVTLAGLIDDTLGMPPHYALTLKNVRDYCDHESLLKEYGIRTNTEIFETDWIYALQICREDRRNHFYRLAKGDTMPRRDRYFAIYHKIPFAESKGEAKITRRSQYA